MLEQHAYDLMTHRYMQWGSAFFLLSTYIRAMLEQNAHDLDTVILSRYVQRGRAVTDPRVYVCTVFKQ
jgi:hypothetical protein